MYPESDVLVSARGLRTWFPLAGHWLGPRDWIRAVDEVDISLRRGEVVGLVGESGCGKSTLGRSLLRLIEPTSGTLRFDGIDITSVAQRRLRPMRRRMQIVFQDPYGSLSPRLTIRRILSEPLRLHRIVPRRETEAASAEWLRKVGLEPYFLDRYPHEMSGGQRQRIAVARAFCLEPDFVVADEPVSALDVSVQAQILGLLQRLQREHQLAMLFISHDLRVVRRVADRIVVMYGGRVVEEGPAEGLTSVPRHPYTQALLSAVPTGEPGRRRARVRLASAPLAPPLGSNGCRFAERCPLARDFCRSVAPALRDVGTEHRVACHYA